MKVILTDIDGTIADNSWRDRFDCSDCVDDPPYFEVIDRILEYELPVIVLTNRDDRFRKQTEEWLNEYLPFKELWMSPDKDKVVDTHIRKYEVQMAFEDDLRTLGMLSRRGIPCVRVRGGRLRSNVV